MENISNKLKDPSPKYRPVPFWSWNDKLDINTLRYQIQEMKKVGMGGYFMHARGGLETEYLSEDWMAAIETGINEAEKEGMCSWAYDEDGWPSGFAGGKVCELGDSYHGRWLEKEHRLLTSKDLDFFKSDSGSSILGIYILSPDQTSFKELNKEASLKAENDKLKCLIISHNSNPYYIDVMSKKVVSQFIEFTHEAYKSRFPDKFDGRFQGFFTDEPRLSGRNIDEDFPWSYGLPKAFTEKYSLSLIENLPSLFFPCGDYESIRYRFWNLVNQLFVNSYIKQLGEWCTENNCKLTGHIMMEETMSTQMPNTGGVMPFYEFMDIPGIDWLRRTMSTPVVPKQVSSVAAQTGKKQILTESFALCGWNAAFEDLKWVAQWQYVNGVNLLCQHLQGYTIRGMRKRDYPPSLFIQQPWWDQYELFNTYFARLGLILSEGINPVDVLVLHPIRSGWILFDGYQSEKLKEMDRSFGQLLETLSGEHIEYHLGDETVMSRHGSVSDGVLTVGNSCYKAVIIPETLTLSTSTLDLLELFIKEGGKIIAINSFPSMEEGFKNTRALKNDKNIIVEANIEQGLLKGDLKKVLSLKDNQTDLEAMDLQVTSRIFENETFWYIVNNSRTKTIQVTARIPDLRKLYLYKPVENSYEQIQNVIEYNDRMAQLTFEPARSMILMASSSKDLPDQKIELSQEEIITTEGSWDLQLQDPNILTLDRCKYSIDGGLWEDEIDVIHLFNLLLERKYPCRLVMEFTFDSHLESSELSDLNLVVELAEEFIISVNKQDVLCDGRTWWKDSSFKKVHILDKLVKGINTIRLEREFYQSDEVYRILYGDNVYETEKNKLTYDVELENIYLTGDFAVNSVSPFTEGGNKALITEGPFYISQLPGKTSPANLTINGLLFFAGKISLKQNRNIEKKPDTRYVLHFDHTDVAMVKIKVNNREVSNLLWAPWEADLTDYIESGDNIIELILYSSNRNMLGPHHHIDGEPFNVGPGSFTGEWSWVEKPSEAVPATEEDILKNYWDKRFAFVPFGLG